MVNRAKPHIFLFPLALATSVCFAQPAVQPAFSLQPGDRWCAVGDSITHGGAWHKYVYLYYATRFPQREFRLINAGCGGDTAPGARRRLEPQIIPQEPTVATVMLGMNDVWMENNQLTTLKGFGFDLEAIIERLQMQGCRVMVITTPPYDWTVQSDAPIDTLREGLERYAEKAREVAQQKQVSCLDYFDFLTSMTLQGQAADPAFSLDEADRTHPTPLGNFVMAWYFLTQTGEQPLVSALSLDAEARYVTRQEKCEASQVAFGPQLIGFTLLEEALPFPVDAVPTGAEQLVPFTQTLNQQLLQVTGLPAGNYDLSIDQMHVDTFSAQALSDGVNLAQMLNTPQSKQAQEVARWNERRHHVTAGQLRMIAMFEHGEFRRTYAIDDAQTPRADLQRRLDKFNDLAKAQAEAKRFEFYLECKANQSQLMKDAQQSEQKIWETNKPIPHVYQIKRLP